MQRFFTAVCAAGLLAVSLQASAAEESTLEKNKRLVREFYEMAFNQHQPLEAAIKYLSEGYKQHNPHVADGRKGFIDAFKGAKKEDKSHTDIKRMIAEGDLVVMHSHGRENPSDPGYAVVDIFRVKDDRIVEHWDVGQKVPPTATAKNSNTMF